MVDFFPDKVNLNIDAILNSKDLDVNNSILAKYNKNGDSIFSKDEIEAFCSDVKLFASKDGSTSSLSEEESVDFYNKLMSDSADYKPVKKFPQNSNPIFSLIKDINRSYDINKNIIPKFRNNSMDKDTISNFRSLSDREYENAKQLIEADKKRLFHADDIFLLAHDEEFIDKRIKIIQMLQHTENNNHLLAAINVNTLEDISDDDLQKITRLINIPDRKFALTAQEITMAAQLSDDYLDDLLKNNPNFEIYKLDSNNCRIKENAQQDICKVYNYEAKRPIGTIKFEDTEDGKTIKIQEDFATNSKRILCTNSSGTELYYEKIYFYDNAGKITRTEDITNGVGGFDTCITTTEPNGNKKLVQWASVDEKTGERNLEKHFVSPEGVKTDYYMEQSSDGTKVSEYRIVDRDGNVLLNQKRTFSKIGENKFQSSLNDKVYEMEYAEPIIKITDKNTGEVHKLDLTGKVEDNKPELWNMLKQMSGDMLLKIENREFNKFLDGTGFPAWDPYEKILGAQIPIDNDDYESFGILMHEFGHFLDTYPDDSSVGVISENNEFVEVYLGELNALKQNAPLWDKIKVDYFADHDGSEMAAREETVAECNLVLTGEYTSVRASILQKYFPKTIAKVAELSNKLV